MNRIIYFLKYHNLVPIILGVILLATAGAFANEDFRNMVIGQKIETLQGVDNSQILAADLDNFNLNLQIKNVSEDEENYYIDYGYQTLAIKENIWQPVIKEETMEISKVALGGEDLGLYAQEELSELADYQLSYLKEVQKLEREKGQTRITVSVDYTGLIGLVLDARNKVLPGYKPVIAEEICDGADNDQNGLTDEGCYSASVGSAGLNPNQNSQSSQNNQNQVSSNIFYYDGDADGYGSSGNFVESQQLEGYVPDNTDCNDSNKDINPGISEICEDGIDNNCNTFTDEGCEVATTTEETATTTEQ